MTAPRMLSVSGTAGLETALSRASSLLHDGRLVAVPTETVYGLAARADDDDAVARIFAAKGRPATNPLIIHIGAIQQAKRYATWNDTAQQLAEKFWPGPLTLVLPRGRGISDLAVAGGATIALRIPAHPVTHMLLHMTGLPVAAPSANRSGSISPTRAEHVAASLGDAVDLILDAGPCALGIESTVLDLTGPTPVILRMGALTPADLSAILGTPVTIAAPAIASDAAERSPGRIGRHYAPRARLLLLEHGSPAPTGLSASVVHLRLDDGTPPPLPDASIIAMPPAPQAYAAHLYAALHEADDSGAAAIVADLPPDTPEWAAVRDRLRRAALHE